MSEDVNTAGSVISVNISQEKGVSKTPVPEIEIDDKGVVGDAHAGPWHRQVSLLGIESIEKFSRASGRAFAYGDFAENITTSGLTLPEMGLLDRLALGGAELEVTQIGKKCHGDGCAIYQEVGRCIMPREGIFCRVIRGGRVKPGDGIAYTRRALRCRVITLSDRAHAGEYADLSGPRVRDLLGAFCEARRWRPAIEGTVLPDEAQPLRAALIAAREEETDVVVTTGGTGIGPRDITPEVVTEVADKLIPGIMEHARVKYGAGKPNALLSRSVAGVMGKTLVYALPGSVKAVEEYLEEILKTLEHAVLMLHGVDTH